MGNREKSIEGVNKFKFISDKMQTWRILQFYVPTKNIKNIFVIRVPEVEGKDNVTEIFEEIKAKVFPNMMENIKLQLLKAQDTQEVWLEKTPHTATS